MTRVGKQSPCFNSVILFVLIFILGCAKSVAPPGGPADVTPPEAVSSTPPTKAVQVSLDSQVIIEFSERLDPRSVKGAVFISPQLKPEPDIRIKGYRLVISPQEPLKPNTTYIVTVGTDLKDAHGVRLDQSLSLAFSTGTEIDEGRISGAVCKGDKTAPNVSLALFEELPPAGELPIDSLIPDYLTQSGADGRYSFQYIPPRTYYLAAFEDLNKNRRINPAREPIGIPYREIVLDTALIDQAGIDIAIGDADPGLIGFKSVSINADGLLRVRLSRAMVYEEINQLFGNLKLTLSADTSHIINITGFSNLTPYPADDFIILTDTLPDSTACRLVADRSGLNPMAPDSLRYIIYPFESVTTPDAFPPRLVESYPAIDAAFIPVDTVFQLRFSEPVACNDWSIAIVAARTDDTVAVPILAVDRLTYNGRPARALDYDKKYILIQTGLGIADLHGNSFADSALAISFTTLPKDTLGRLSGMVNRSRPEEAVYPIILEIKATDNGTASRLRLDRGEVEFSTELLPGYYRVSGFIDRNHNGQYDHGSLWPYVLAEPFSMPVDTFRVRTRFETTGIIVEF